MIVMTFPSGPLETNAYVITVSARETPRAAIILDPAPGSSKPIKEWIKKEGLIPKAILLTHSHWDHIAEVSDLKETYKIPVYIHKADAENLIHPGSDRLPCWITIKGVVPDHLLEGNENLSIDGLNFQVIHTPGHSPGCVCYYNAENGVLMSGDTLFEGGIGNLSLATSQPNLMAASLKKLATLPSQTKVYPGHGSSTTIGAEKNLLLHSESLW